MRRGFVKNPRFDDEMQRDIAHGVETVVAAHLVRAIHASAPTGGTGAYSASVAVDASGGEVRVITTDPFWHLIEFGSMNNPPYAPIRRGVRAAGLRLDESR